MVWGLGFHTLSFLEGRPGWGEGGVRAQDAASILAYWFAHACKFALLFKTA